ncbi:MAG: DUF3108 domain-containing protein [Burkholderiales bacterium]
MTTRARLAIAALLSLAFHTLVISGEWLPLPQAPGAPRLLQARLAPPPELKPAVPRPKVRAARRAALAPVPEVAAVAAASPLNLPDFLADDAPEDEAVEQPSAPEPPQQLALAAGSSVAAAAHSLPRRGRISFTLFYGDERHYIGTVVQSWEAGAHSYLLASEAETGGLVELLWSQRIRYVSRGRITPRGLQPESFLASRTRRGRNEAAQARFDWSAGSLNYGYAHEQKNVPLPADTQDLMSFIFQYALAPPAPGRYRLPITTGTRFEVYDIVVSGEERIETPLGALRALPVRQLPRSGEESIEIWLAADYHYLPVRIRHFDRRGKYSGEQVASEIRISEE